MVSYFLVIDSLEMFSLGLVFLLLGLVSMVVSSIAITFVETLFLVVICLNPSYIIS
jgi:hypothetical protein